MSTDPDNSQQMEPSDSAGSVPPDNSPIAGAIDRLTSELREHRLAGKSIQANAAEIPEPPAHSASRPSPVLPLPGQDPLDSNSAASRKVLPGPLAIIIALILVVLGQRAIENGTSFFQLSQSTEDRLRTTWQNPESVITAIILFAAAISVLVISVLFRGRPLPGARTIYRLFDGISVATIGIGLSIFIWVMLSLNGGNYEPSYPRWYLLSLVLILFGLGRRERKILRELLPISITTKHIFEGASVVALVGVFLFLAMRDIRNWRYVSIGDEHAFYDVTLWFSDGRGPQNLFTNEGVYGYHPMLSSYLVSQVMRVFGEDVFGWRLGYNLLAAIGLVFFYLLARVMFNRVVALVALGLIVTSHYLLAFAHIGYNNLEPILSSCAALFFFVLAIRRSSMTLFTLAGLFAGLGWYTFYSGRITIGILAVATLLIIEKRHWLRTAFFVGAGYILAVLPIVLVSGQQMYERMRIETVATPEGPPRSDLSRLLINTGRSLLAFNYSTVRAHYVTGSLAEPITAALFLLGVLIALVTIRDWRSRLLLTWFVIGIAATGIVSKYDFVPITRLHYVLPCVVIFAAATAVLVVNAAMTPLPTRWRRHAVWIALALIVGSSAFLDLRRWYVTSPALAGSSHTSVIWRAMNSDSCQSLGLDPVLVTVDGDGHLDWVIREHQPDFGVQHVHYGAPPDWIETAPQRCVIIRNPDQPEAQAVIAAIQQRWPAIISTTVTNDANAEVQVLAPIPIEVD